MLNGGFTDMLNRHLIHTLYWHLTHMLGGRFIHSR